MTPTPTPTLERELRTGTLSRRSFCFLGLGFLASGAMDPTVLLRTATAATEPRYWTTTTIPWSAIAGTKVHMQWVTNADPRQLEAPYTAWAAIGDQHDS